METKWKFIAIWAIASFSIIAFIAVTAPNGYATSHNDYVYRGDSYTDIDHSDGSHSWNTENLIYVDSYAVDSFNGKPVFVPYKIDDNAEWVTFASGSLSWTFYKDTCNFKLFNGGRVTETTQPVVESISITMQEMINDEWVNTPHNDQPCEVTVNYLPNNTVQLIAKQGFGGNDYMVTELKQQGGDYLETFYRTPPASFNGQQYGFNESHIKTQDVIHDSLTYQLGMNTDVVLDRSDMINTFGEDLPIEMKNEHGQVLFDVKNRVHDALTSVTITEYTSDKLQTFYDFHNAQPLNVGEILEIDPTYETTTQNIDGRIDDNGDNDVCDNNGSMNNYALSTYNLMRIYFTGNAYDCSASYHEWDVSSITDGSTVTSSKMRMYLEQADDNDPAWLCEFHGMTYQPSVASDANIMNSMLNDPVIDTSIDCLDNGWLDNASGGFILDQDADDYIEGQLDDDWVAISYTFEDHAGALHATDTASMPANSDSGNSPPRLTINYNLACTPSAPTSVTAESDGLTEIDLTWVAPTNCSGTDQAVQVEESPDGSTGWSDVYNGAVKTSHTTTSLSSNEDYFYRISYQSDNDYSAVWGTWSSNVSDLTTPSAPTSLQVDDLTDSTIDFSWTPPSGSGALTYLIEIQVDGGGWTTEQASHSGVSYQDTSLMPATQYEYRVSAINSDSTGVPSNVIDSTTFSNLVGITKFTQSNIGNVLNFTNITVDMLSGLPCCGDADYDTLRVYQDNVLIMTDTFLIPVVTHNNTTPMPEQLYEVDDLTSYEYSIFVDATSLEGTFTMIPDAGENFTKAVEYIPSFQIADTPSLGYYNYTLDESDPSNRILKINRPFSNVTDSWTANCKTVTGFNDAGLVWHNRTGVPYYNEVITVASGENVYINCFNPDDPLFRTISYGNLTGILAGFSSFDDQLGSWFGLPIIFMFVFFIAGLFGGRQSGTSMVVTLSVIAILGGIGLIVIDEAIWGIILVLGALGLFASRVRF